jgi:hypothetical protein
MIQTYTATLLCTGEKKVIIKLLFSPRPLPSPRVFCCAIIIDSNLTKEEEKRITEEEEEEEEGVEEEEEE